MCIRAEILALGMSFGTMEGCIRQVKSWQGLDSHCEGEIYEFIDVAGEVLKKEKCIKPLNQFVNMKIVKIDMRPIFKVFTDTNDCQKKMDKAVCQKQAMPDLQLILDDFVTEIFSGLTDEFIKNTRTFGDYFVQMWKCASDAPSIQKSISVNDFKKFEDKSAKLLQTINKMRGDPTKNTVMDQNQMWIMERVLEFIDEQSPMTKGMLGNITPQNIPDLHTCLNAFKNVENSLSKVLANKNGVHTLITVVFDRLIFLNPMRPFIEAFVDTSTKLTEKLIPDVNCLFIWDRTDVGSLFKCFDTVGDSAKLYADEFITAKDKHTSSDESNGWSDAIGGSPADFIPSDTIAPAPPLVPDTRPINSDMNPSTHATGTSTTSESSNTKQESDVKGVSHSGVEEFKRHSHLIRNFACVILFFCCAVTLGAIVHIRVKHRGTMYTEILDNDEMFDVEARGLLHELSEDDESSDDDEPIAL
eukprot:CFRG0033T1